MVNPLALCITYLRISKVVMNKRNQTNKTLPSLQLLMMAIHCDFHHTKIKIIVKLIIRLKHSFFKFRKLYLPLKIVKCVNV